jgi:hypothetical protein
MSHVYLASHEKISFCTAYTADGVRVSDEVFRKMLEMIKKIQPLNANLW